MEKYLVCFWHIFLTVAILGILGNISMLVVYLQPKFKKLSVSTYFCAMSLSNLVINISAILEFMAYFYEIDIFAMSQLTYKTLSFVLFLAI